MIKVVFVDGYELEGESYEELATKLWFDSFSDDENVQAGIVKFSLAPKLVLSIHTMLTYICEVKGKVEIFQRFVLKNTT